MKKPFVSVIMPCYNAENFLKFSIESILEQSFKDFEFIIINDGSTDKTLDIIHSYKDDRIIVINQTNKGIAYSLNKAIEISKGNYIARMDADDISLKERFEIQLKYFEENKNVDLLGGAMKFINVDGNYLGRSFSIINNRLINYYMNNIGNIFAHPSLMIKKTVFEEIGMYHPSLFAKQDYHLWNKFLRHNAILKNIPDVLIKYRISENSISSKNSFNRKSSMIFNEILSIDLPSEKHIEDLKKEVSNTKYLKNVDRNKNFNNLENKLFFFLKIIIGGKKSEILTTNLKNMILYLKFIKVLNL